MNETKSPIAAEVGKVKLNAPPDVLQKYPLPATAFDGSAVMTACHEAPPVTSAQDKAPEPLFERTCPDAVACAPGHVKVYDVVVPAAF